MNTSIYSIVFSKNDIIYCCFIIYFYYFFMITIYMSSLFNNYKNNNRNVLKIGVLHLPSSNPSKPDTTNYLINEYFF